MDDTNKNKFDGAEKARIDAQKQFEDAERHRRQREASEKAKLELYRRQNNQKTGPVNLNLEKVPTTRRMEPPKARVDKASNRQEIMNIKEQARMSSSSNSKLTIKQSLGRNAKNIAQDAIESSSDNYAAAEYSKKQANRGVHAAATAIGLGGAMKVADSASEGFSRLKSNDSAQEMTKIASDIAVKGADNVINYKENRAKRAEDAVRKQTKKVEKLDKKYDKLNSKELKTRDKAGKSYDKADKYKTKADKYNAKGKSGKADKYSLKAEKKSARGDKLNSKSNKLRDKRSKKNLKLGKKRGKAVAKLNTKKVKAQSMKKLASKGFKKIALKVCAVVAVPVVIVFFIATLLGGTASAGGYLASKFVSEIFSFLSLEWTATGKELARLENMNWGQYIADDTVVSLGGTFVDAAKKDAQKHYTDRKVSLGTALNQLGDNNYPRYDWYCDLGEGSIGNVWMREQCDKITDQDGKMIYDNEGHHTNKSYTLLYTDGGKLDMMAQNYGYDMSYAYEEDASNRLTITPNANIVPILSLAHDRYTEEWTWENYEVVQAYVWYMYTLSHNAAHYDDNVDDDSGTYTYEVQQICDHSLFSKDSFLEEFSYDSDALSINRPGTKGISCTNVYVHGYTSEEIFGNTTFKNEVKEKAKKAAKKVLSWVDALVEAVTGDDSDLSAAIMGAGTYLITYERDSESGYITGNKFYASQGNDEIEKNNIYWTNEILGGVADGNGTLRYCDNVQYLRKDGSTVCGKSEHYHDAGSCTCDTPIHIHNTGTCVCDTPLHEHDTGSCTCSKVEHKHDDTCATKKVLICDKTEHTHRYSGNPADSCWSNGYYGTQTCGQSEHKHDDSCYKIETDCSIEEHSHGKDCCTTKEHKGHGSACCTIKGHKKHTSSCCTIKHTTHQPWVDANNPGCYDTFAYCAGHCGGHVKPTVNIAVTYTMEGLAYQDAVALNAGESKGKDSSWTCSSDFRSLIGELEDATSLKEWANITNKKCARWFKPGPNGPVSAICYIGDCIKDGYFKVFRGWRNFWKAVGDKISEWIFGDKPDSPKYNDVSSDPGDLEDLEEGKDDHKFEGWFTGSGADMTFQSKLFKELHELYGDPDDFYQIGVKTWKEFDVFFHLGFGKVLTNDEIFNIKDAIVSTYFSTEEEQTNPKNQARLQIIETALESCGYFNYNKNAVFNGNDKTMGSISSLGFVSNIYMRALGDDCGFGKGGIVNKHWASVSDSESVGCTTGGIYDYTNNKFIIKPGDVIAIGDGVEKKDEAAIYLGYFRDPRTGEYGHFIVDCVESSNKTSSCRMLTDAQLKKYYMYYRPTVIE